MRRLLPLLLAVSLPAHAQAPSMRPPPVRPPPAHTPGYQPYAPPEAVHTPAGAGASHGGLAAPERSVPRSPNKRLLPLTKEAGLWAADGSPVARSVRLFGVDIDLMTNEHGLDVAGETEMCTRAITEAADGLGVLSRLQQHSKAERACMAARAYFGCALDHFQWTIRGLTVDQRGGSIAYHDAKATLDHARRLEAKNCPGAPLSDEQNAMLRAILSKWKENAEAAR